MKSPKSLAFWPLLLSLVALDCTTKDLAVERLTPPHVPHPVVGDVVRLTLTYNPQAAMGLSLGSHSRAGFAVIAAVILGVLVLYRRRISSQSVYATVALALIAGGAAGNLIDRLRSSRGVIDFIDIGIGNSRFYTFNVADTSVVCGTLILMVILVRKDRLRASPS